MKRNALKATLLFIPNRNRTLKAPTGEEIGMIIEISVAVIALAFVILVIYLISLTKALILTSHQINHILLEGKKKIEEMGGQAAKIIEHTNQVSFDVKRKIESLNSIFNTLSNVGEVLEHKTADLKKKALFSSGKENERVEIDSSEKLHLPPHELNKVADILELTCIGIRLWQKIKKKGDK